MVDATLPRLSGRGGAAVMEDVAARAGVSHQTVSRVLNGRPGVRASTRERVLAAMAELNYRPSTAARSLARGRSQAIGVVVLGTSLYGPTATTRSVEEAVRAAGYGVSTETLTRFDRPSVLEALDRLLRQAVDGVVVVVPPTDADDAVAAMAGTVPVVVVGAGCGDVPAAVSIDGRLSTRRAVRHLLQLGHRTVAHVAGPQEWPAGRQRLEGWREELRAAGAPEPEPLLGDWTAASGYQAGRRLAADPTVTAVFAANDQMALGVLRALHEAGRRVPEDVSVVGFDDLPEAAYFTPPLTTLRQDFELEGRLGVRMLLAQVEQQRSAAASGAGGADAPACTPGPLDAAPVCLVPELILRSTTAPPPDRRPDGEP